MAAYTTIDDPEAYFQTVLYTGNDTARTITLPGDTAMAPDLIWIKNYVTSAEWHRVANSVVGYGVQQSSGNSNAQDTNALGITGSVSTGFTLGTDANNIGVNETGEVHVAWCWKANGTGSANTAGSINTTATSVESTAKFSISTFEGNATAGATLGHGLGSVPKFMMFKNRDSTQSWAVYHHKNTAAPETDRLALDTTAATADDAGMWNDVAPSSTLITLGDDDNVNASESLLNYVWDEVQGFSKFGQYEGNGNADGAFVYTGFRPGFIMIKSIDSTSSWLVFDNKRLGYNVDNDALDADGTSARTTTDMIDILANGFKCRIATDPNVAETYVYVAWAYAPFVNSGGVPGNAR